MKFSALKKRNIFTAMLLITFLLTLTIMGGCANGENTGEGEAEAPDTSGAIDLSFAHFFPDVHVMSQEVVDGWGKAIEEATDGKVTVTNYPGETLLKADKTYEGVVDGVADVGLSFFSYNRGRFPLMETPELPGIVYNNSTVAAKVGMEFMKIMEPEELKETKVLMVGTSGPVHVITKDVPVRTLEDLSGLELQCTGLSALSVEALGAVPVAMPMSETYEALSRGVVKGTVAPIEALEGFNLVEESDYLTFSNFVYSGLYYITMNKQTWDSFSPEIQSIIEETTAEFYEEVVAGIFDRMDESAYELALEQGVEFITLSEEEAERWKEKLIPVQEDYLSEDDGLPREEALELVKELAEKYNNEYPSILY